MVSNQHLHQLILCSYLQTIRIVMISESSDVGTQSNYFLII